MGKAKYHRITWRGFSGRLHRFPKRCFLRDGWWCYEESDGKTYGLCLAIMNGIVKATPWPKGKK
jgi:hypothetical protein